MGWSVCNRKIFYLFKLSTIIKGVNCYEIHNRDVNASLNIKREGIRILKEQGITIITLNNSHTVGTTGIHAFGDLVRPHSIEAVIDGLGIHVL